MKRFKLIAAVACLTAMTIIACQKDLSSTSGTRSNGKLVASKTDVKVGEPITVTLQNSGSNSLVHWTITPDAGVTKTGTLTYGSNQLKFTYPGTYKVVAAWGNGNTNTIFVPWPDSSHHPKSDSSGHPGNDSSYHPYPWPDSSYHPTPDTLHYPWPTHDPGTDSSYNHGRDSITIIVHN